VIPTGLPPKHAYRFVSGQLYTSVREPRRRRSLQLASRPLRLRWAGIWRRRETMPEPRHYRLRYLEPIPANEAGYITGLHPRARQRESWLPVRCGAKRHVIRWRQISRRSKLTRVHFQRERKVTSLLPMLHLIEGGCPLHLRGRETVQE
jgi:hypothetical protein